MKKRCAQKLGIVLGVLAVLLIGFYVFFIGGLAYSRNLSSLEKQMHPEQQTDTIWISNEEDLYLINDGGTLLAFVLWQGEWHEAEFLRNGARFQTLLLEEKPLLRGNFSMKRENELRLTCSDDSQEELSFANKRKHLILCRFDLHAKRDSLPFIYGT